MKPRDQARRRSFQPNGGRGCLLLFGVVLLSLAGCEGFPSRRQHDPLLGTQAPPQPVASTGGTANTPTQTAAADQTPPSMPASYTAPGQAALAGGETPTSEQGRDLRIPASTSTPASLPGTAAARGVAPGVTVGNPEPATNASTSNLTPVPIAAPAARANGASTVAASAAAGMTFDQAQRLLNQYRVSWQRLDKFDGQWKFECGVPNPSNPAMNRHFFTTKAFPDEVSAIREVISQIEKDPIVKNPIK